MLVFGVPRINLAKELTAKFKRFGEVSCSICTQKMAQENCKYRLIPVIDGSPDPSVCILPADELEQFTDCYLVKFVAGENARKAKKFLDATSFYGGVLHISYAPELETIDETRAKLQRRAQDVAKRVIVSLSSPEDIAKNPRHRVISHQYCAGWA